MSTGERRWRRRQRGFTFPEVAVLLGVASLLALVVERSLTSTHASATYLEAVRRATERGQRVSYEVYGAVSASHRLFQRDAVGLGYLDALDLSRLPRTATSRLPVIDELGDLGPDAAGDAHTGNVLLFVQESDAVTCVADPQAGRTRAIDTYRFVCIYPTEADEPLVAGEPRALDLVLWRSIPYPSRPQILGIEDEAERGRVVRDLCHRYGHDLAWEPAADAASAFYALDGLGGIAETPDADVPIEADPDVSGWGRLVAAGVGLARTSASVHHRDAVFASETPEGWAPDGFEVKVVGLSGSRKVWIHLVAESAAGRGRLAVHPNTMIASVRDL